MFLVVEDQLRVSEGWVRCGRCTHVFNALEDLLDVALGTPVHLDLGALKSSPHQPSAPVAGDHPSALADPTVDPTVDPRTGSPPDPRASWSTDQTAEPETPAPDGAAPAAFPAGAATVGLDAGNVDPLAQPPWQDTPASAPPSQSPAPPPPPSVPWPGMQAPSALWPLPSEPAAPSQPPPLGQKPSFDPGLATEILPSGWLDEGGSKAEPEGPHPTWVLSNFSDELPDQLLRTPSVPADLVDHDTLKPIEAMDLFSVRPARPGAATPPPLTGAASQRQSDDRAANLRLTEPPPAPGPPTLPGVARPGAADGFSPVDKVDLGFDPVPEREPGHGLDLDLDLDPVLDAGLDDRPSDPSQRDPWSTTPNEEPPSFVRQAERAERWRSGPMRGFLIGMAMTLSLLLTAQAAYLWRDSLAAHVPRLVPALNAVCETLGCELAPLRRIEHWAVDSSGLSRINEPLGPQGHRYRLSLMLHNRANTALMTPAVELTLTDSRGDVVARKVLTMAEFGGPPGAAAAGQELPLRALLATGERRIEGYTVELFYP